MKEGSWNKRKGSCSRDAEPRVHGLVQAMLLLLIGEAPRHGYELFKVLSVELPEALVPDVAVVYSILRNLEKGGCISSRLAEGEGGPARKVYTLTREGKIFLAERYESIGIRVDALKLFLKRYEQFTSSGESRRKQDEKRS